MAKVYNFADSLTWVSRYTNSVEGLPAIVPGNFEAIPDLIIPVVFQGEAIAIQASSDNAKETWKLAGWVWQRVLINIATGASAPNSIVTPSYKFYLEELTTIVIPRLSNTYGLMISFPHWLPQLDFEIYEYIGEVSDTIEDRLELIQFDLTKCLENDGNGSADSGTNSTTQQQTTIATLTNFF